MNNPILALRNLRIVAWAFYYTALRIQDVRLVKKMRNAWNEEKRGKYIWGVAKEKWANKILRKAEITVLVIGKPDWTHAHIIAANHQSILDILGLVRAVENGRFVCKKEIVRTFRIPTKFLRWLFGREYVGYPIVGAGVAYGGQIIIDRKNPEAAMKEIKKGLQNWPDSNLIFFVEGTRTKTGKLGKFRKGAFVNSIEQGLPILLVAISEAHGALPKGSFLNLEKQPIIRIEFGEELWPREGETAPEFAERAKVIVQGMLDKAALE